MSFWDTYTEPESTKEKARREAWEHTLSRNAAGLCNECNTYTDDLMFGSCPDCGRVNHVG